MGMHSHFLSYYPKETQSENESGLITTYNNNIPYAGVSSNTSKLLHINLIQRRFENED